jgi:2'-5' RNA ligase
MGSLGDRGSRAVSPTGYRDHHATIFLPTEVAREAEAARARWDPVMAGRIAAHVTVAYPEEAPDVALLVERLREAAAGHPPFRLCLGDLDCYGRPEAGVYVRVEDVEGGYRRLREALLRPPFQTHSFPPHVTLVHPRTSLLGPELWRSARTGWREQAFTVTAVAVTGFDGDRWAVLHRIALGDPREGAAP